MIIHKTQNYILKLLLVSALGLGFGLSSNLFADSFRFKNKVIDTGMSKGKVFMITGQPDWKASYMVGDPNDLGSSVYHSDAFSGTSRINAFSGTYDPVSSVMVEEWLINRGKNRLMQILRFEDQRLVGIDSIGYGFDEKYGRSFANPDWSLLKTGDTSYEVINRFGEPSITETKPNISFVRIYGPHRHPLHFRSAEVSWWYYNQGPSRLFRIVKLVNGRVVDIEIEGYGVSEK
ncbi:MAG: DUF2845 domain-containing protein [Verrucomicrobia bacterium]|nr:DUF2845 domain-containing protein [Verrucomicrobiota bacterium]MDA1069606.1 DUF2845 domain-containing protein [Verrucomicrobiota bacterium]